MKYVHGAYGTCQILFFCLFIFVVSFKFKQSKIENYKIEQNSKPKKTKKIQQNKNKNSNFIPPPHPFTEVFLLFCQISTHLKRKFVQDVFLYGLKYIFSVDYRFKFKTFYTEYFIIVTFE